MLPKRIESCLKNIIRRQNETSLLIEGRLHCCNSQDFSIKFEGKLKKILGGKMYIYSADNRIVLEACCLKCGKNILVFDSNRDGYEQCDCNDSISSTNFKELVCNKCKHNNYSINIKYEYPNIQELEEEGIVNVDNAFTWIWISIKCNECGTEYRKLIDFETA